MTGRPMNSMERKKTMTDPLHSLLVSLSNAFDGIGRRFADMAHARRQRLADRARERSVHPLGYWRCTHVNEMFAHGFAVGSIYEARHEPAGTSSIRVIPTNHSGWSPYWDKRRQRFCYEAHQIDFEYVGPVLPAGETCATSERLKKAA